MPGIFDDAAITSSEDGNLFPFRNLDVFLKDDEEDDVNLDIVKDEEHKKNKKQSKKLKRSSKKGHQWKSTKEKMAYDVALKLRDAGLPTRQELEDLYASSLGTDEGSSALSSSSDHDLVPYIARVKSVEEIVQSLTRTEVSLLNNSLLTALSSTRPDESKPLSDGSDLSRNSIGMEDIGGLDMIKEELSEIIYSMSNPHLMSGAYGSLLNAPKGLLLYGPPGCGKTMLARALSKEAGTRFLCIAPSNLLRKYVGETNQMVKSLFSLVSNSDSNTIIDCNIISTRFSFVLGQKTSTVCHFYG